MKTYADIIAYIQSLYGPGKEFKTQKSLADHYGIDPVLAHRHLGGKRGAQISPFFNMLESLGFEILFPTEAPGSRETHKDKNSRLQEEIDSLKRERDALEKANSALERLADNLQEQVDGIKMEKGSESAVMAQIRGKNQGETAERLAHRLDLDNSPGA